MARVFIKLHYQGRLHSVVVNINTHTHTAIIVGQLRNIGINIVIILRGAKKSSRACRPKYCVAVVHIAFEGKATFLELEMPLFFFFVFH